MAKWTLRWGKDGLGMMTYTNLRSLESGDLGAPTPGPVHQVLAEMLEVGCDPAPGDFLVVHSVLSQSPSVWSFLPLARC